MKYLFCALLKYFNDKTITATLIVICEFHNIVSDIVTVFHMHYLIYSYKHLRSDVLRKYYDLQF